MCVAWASKGASRRLEKAALTSGPHRRWRRRLGRARALGFGWGGPRCAGWAVLPRRHEGGGGGGRSAGSGREVGLGGGRARGPRGGGGGHGPATQAGRWDASRLKREKGVDFLFIYLFIFLFSLLFRTIRCIYQNEPPIKWTPIERKQIYSSMMQQSLLP
jgi:hypothetical protein